MTTTAGAIAGMVWLYMVALGTLLATLAVVALCVHLLVRGHWRGRTIAAAMLAGLVLLVLWVIR